MARSLVEMRQLVDGVASADRPPTFSPDRIEAHDDARVGSALALATAILGPLSAWALARGLKPYGRLIAETAGAH